MNRAIMKKAIRLFVALCLCAATPAYPEATDGMPSFSGSGKISLDVKGMDVVEVIKMLATKANMNVIVGSAVQGRVTMFLKDVDITDAFEIVLLSANLASDKQGDILYIMPQREFETIYGERYADKKEVKVFPLKYAKAADVSKALNQMKSKVGKIIVDDGSNTVIVIDGPATVAQMEETVKNLDKPIVTKIYELKYAKAADLKAQVTESLTKGIGTMQLDERTNKIVVTDVEKNAEKIGKMIDAFDSKLQQVLIEAKILEVTLNDQYKLGIDWEIVTRVFQNVLKNQLTVTNAFNLATTGGLTPGGEMLIGTFDSGAYAAMIQALKVVGDTNTLSSPRITAMNNTEAKILVGSNQPYATNTVTQGTATTTTATNLTFLDIGVKLYVTPSINKDGFISIKIRPEVSSRSGTYTYGSPATTVPIVSTTQAETSVMVKDGTTIIIAGLITDERTSSVNKIPIAGNLPFLGVAFRKTEKSVGKKELVIFITPHIISGETDVLKQPTTQPFGEKLLTVPEAPAFERRIPRTMDATMFKKKYQKWDEAQMPPVAAAGSADTYYAVVRKRIVDNLRLPEDTDTLVPGDKVVVSFVLYAGGNLASKPEIMETSNEIFSALAIKAVLAAEPFPAFPPSVKGRERSFSVDLVYE